MIQPFIIPINSGDEEEPAAGKQVKNLQIFIIKKLKKDIEEGLWKKPKWWHEPVTLGKPYTVYFIDMTNQEFLIRDDRGFPRKIDFNRSNIIED